MGPGHCHIPSGMVVRGGRRQSVCGVTRVIEEHFLFVKRTLTYLALGILGWEAATGIGEGWYGPEKGLRLGV